MKARALFYCSLLALLALAYMRFTWYMDINISGRPLLVRINKAEKTETLQAPSTQKGAMVVSESLKMRSVAVFWILFGFANMALLGSYFRNRFAIAAHLALYGMLSLLSIVLFALWKYSFPEDFLFQIASKIKNFLLTPLYSGLVFIFVKYFDSFVDNRER